MKEDLKPPPFLIHGVLHPGSVGFLGGNPNVGKTYAALHMLASVGQGIPWFGLPTEPGPAGGIFLESPRWMLQERLNAVCNGWNPSGCAYLKTAADLGADSIDVCNPRQRAWIVEYCLEREPQLLVIEPFAFLHRLDEKETQAAVTIGDALKGIARETGAAVVILDHFRKSLGKGSEDVLQALRGAIAKSAFAGTVMGLDTYQGTVRLRFGKVAASILPEPVYLDRDPKTGALTVTDAPQDQRDARADRMTQLQELVRDGQPHTAEEMGDHVGLKADTITKRYVPELGMVKVGGSKNVAYRFSDTPLSL